MTNAIEKKRHVLPRTRKGRFGLAAALVATSLTGGAIAASWPASAAGTTKIADTGDWMTANSFEFRSPRFQQTRQGNVKGTVTMFVGHDGHYRLAGHVKNENIAWRNVRFHCTLQWGAVNNKISVSTPRRRVDGKESRDVGTSPVFDARLVDADHWQSVRMNGTVDCTMDVG